MGNISRERLILKLKREYVTEISHSDVFLLNIRIDFSTVRMCILKHLLYKFLSEFDFMLF